MRDLGDKPLEDADGLNHEYGRSNVRDLMAPLPETISPEHSGGPDVRDLETDISVPDLIKFNDFYTCKESIVKKNDNIIYFLDLKGNPMDLGSQELFEEGFLKPHKGYEEGLIKFKKKKFYEFIICLKRENMNSIEEYLKEVKEFMLKNKLKSLCFRERNIGSITWEKVVELLKKVFDGKGIKVIF